MCGTLGYGIVEVIEDPQYSNSVRRRDKEECDAGTVLNEHHKMRGDVQEICDREDDDGMDVW